jgi:hypothetical protein
MKSSWISSMQPWSQMCRKEWILVATESWALSLSMINKLYCCAPSTNSTKVKSKCLNGEITCKGKTQMILGSFPRQALWMPKRWARWSNNPLSLPCNTPLQINTTSKKTFFSSPTTQEIRITMVRKLFANSTELLKTTCWWGSDVVSVTWLHMVS